jgi:hypothetical protein
MAEVNSSTLFGGLFVPSVSNGTPGLSRHPAAARALPDPQTGRALAVATVEIAGGICPSCEEPGRGGFVSFVADLRMVYACPRCESLVWVAGA